VQVCRNVSNNLNNPRNNLISQVAYSYVRGGRAAYERLTYRKRKMLRAAAKNAVSLDQATVRQGRVKEGQVYMITNPAWPGWYKIGCAANAHSRCTGYHTGSPFRDYEVYAKSPVVEDSYRSEQEFHKHVESMMPAWPLNPQGYTSDRQGEWFYLTPKCAEMVEMDLQHIT